MILTNHTQVGISAGAFAFASGMLGYYTLGNLMCQEALKFSFPMGDTSHYFKRGTGAPNPVLQTQNARGEECDLLEIDVV